MIAANVTDVAVSCQAFAAHHGPPLPTAGTGIELEAARERGGFGGIHPVVAVAGSVPTPAIVAKLFDPDALAASGGAVPVRRLMGQLYRRLDGQEPLGSEAQLDKAVRQGEQRVGPSGSWPR